MMEYLVHEFAVQRVDVRVQRISSAQEAYEYLKSIDFIVGSNKKHIILDMPTASTQELITKNLEDKVQYTTSVICSNKILTPTVISELRKFHCILTSFQAMMKRQFHYLMVNLVRS